MGSRVTYPAAMTPRGGARPGAGRKPRAEGAATVSHTVWLTETEAAELTGGLRDGETVSSVLRDGGLRIVRSRKPPVTP